MPPPTKYKVTQKVLSDFVSTMDAIPDLTQDEVFTKFPEFKNDTAFLNVARDYYATSKSGKYKTEAELNSKFPEFEFSTKAKPWFMPMDDLSHLEIKKPKPVPFRMDEDIKSKKARHEAIAGMDYKTLEETVRSKKSDSDNFINGQYNNLFSSITREDKLLETANKVMTGNAKLQDWDYLKAGAPIIAEQIKQLTKVKADTPAEIQKMLDGNKLQNENEMIDAYASSLSGKFEMSFSEQEFGKLGDDAFVNQKVAEYDKQAKDAAMELRKSRDAEMMFRDDLSPFNSINDNAAISKENEIKAQMQQKKLTLAQASVYAKIVSGSLKNENPVELGMQILKIVDPDKYAQMRHVKPGNSSFHEVESLALPVMLAAGQSSEEQKMHLKAMEGLDKKYPYYKKADEVKARLEAELFKTQNIVWNRTDLKKADEAAKQLSAADKEVYDKYLRAEIGVNEYLIGMPYQDFRRLVNPAVNDRGVLKSFVAGVTQPFEGIADFAVNFNKTADERINDQLDRPFKETWRSDKGKFAPAVARAKQLEEKAKTQPLSADELNEKDDIKTYTDYVSGAENFVDKSVNLLGNVVAYGVLTKVIGAAVSPVLKSIAGTGNAMGTLGFEIGNAIAGGGLVNQGTKFVISKTLQNNVGGLIAGYTASVDGHKNTAAVLFPDEPMKQDVYGQLMAMGEAFSERIFKDEKIFNAFRGKFKVNLATALKAVSKDGLNNLATQSLVKQAFRDAVKFVGITAGEASKESLEEAAVEFEDVVLKMGMGPKSVDMKKEIAEIGTVFADTFIHMGIPASMAGYKGFKENRVSVPLIAQIGRPGSVDFTNSLISGIRKAQRDGEMTADEASEKIQVIQALKNANTAAATMLRYGMGDGKVTTRQFDKYVVTMANEALLQQRADKTQDPVLKKGLEKQIAESQKIREQIIEGSVYVDEDFAVLTPEEAAAQQAATNVQAQADATATVAAIAADPAVPALTVDAFNAAVNNAPADAVTPGTPEMPIASIRRVGNEYIVETKEGKELSRHADITAAGEALDNYEKAKQKPAAAPITPAAVEVAINPALKDVESTSKALDSETVSQSDFNKVKKLISDDIMYADDSFTKSSPEIIAEEYHKAKKDNSNPALVEAVETLLAVIPVESQYKIVPRDDFFAVVDANGKRVSVHLDENGAKNKIIELDKQDQDAREKATANQASTAGKADQSGKDADGQKEKTETGTRQKPIVQNEIHRKALATEETDSRPESIVKRFFIAGGRIHSSAIQKVFGGRNVGLNTGSADKGVNTERKGRIGLISNDGPTIDKLAEDLWDNQQENMQERYPLSDFRDAVESVLSSYNSRSEMAQSLVDDIDIDEKAQQEWYDNMLIGADEHTEDDLNDAMGMLEGLTEAEIDELIAMDEAALDAWAADNEKGGLEILDQAAFEAGLNPKPKADKTGVSGETPTGTGQLDGDAAEDGSEADQNDVTNEDEKEAAPKPKAKPKSKTTAKKTNTAGTTAAGDAELNKLHTYPVGSIVRNTINGEVVEILSKDGTNVTYKVIYYPSGLAPESEKIETVDSSKIPDYEAYTVSDNTPTPPTKPDPIDDLLGDLFDEMNMMAEPEATNTEITNIAPDSPRAKAIVDNIKKLFKRIVGFKGVQILSAKDFAAAVDEAGGKGTFTKANGQVYGMEHKGVIYLNAAMMNANTPVHEAAHVFLKWAKLKNQVLFKAGLEIARKSPYYAQVKANPVYANASENVQAEEALAWMVGAMGNDMQPGVQKNAVVKLWDKLITKVTEAIHGYKIDTPAQMLAYMNGYRLKKGIAVENLTEAGLSNMNWLEFGYAFADRILSGKPLAKADISNGPSVRTEMDILDDRRSELFELEKATQSKWDTGLVKLAKKYGVKRPKVGLSNMGGVNWSAAIDEIEKRIYDNADFQLAELRAATAGGANLMAAPLTDRQKEMAVKLVDMFIQKQVYKFEDMVAAAIGKMGENAAVLFPAMQAGYNDYYNNEATDTVAAKMDASIRGIKFENIKPKTDVPNRPGNSQQNSGNAANGVTPNATTISGNGGRSGGNGGRSTSKGRSQNRKSNGGQGVLDLFAPAIGTQGNSSLSGSEPGPGISSAGTGGSDGRGNSTTGTTGHTYINAGGISSTDTPIQPSTGSFAEQVARKLTEQRNAEPIEVVSMDEANIRATLPFLLPEQQDDVLKAEKRFFGENKGKGMLFTNGTGTGKTYTGLGIIKRFVKQGKGNVLIVVPSQNKVSDWANDGRNLGLDISELPDTSTGGNGVVVTTYANFRANDELLKRDFDLIVYDESHRLLENKNGEASGTSGQHYEASNKDVSSALFRITSRDPLWIEVKRLKDQYRNLSNMRNGLDAMEEKRAEWGEQMDAIDKQLETLEAEQERRLPGLRERATRAVENTKVVFLSATPFKAHFNLRYVNGYLFDWGTESETNARGSRVDAESRFFLENFGSAYEWKYHRLQVKSGANPDAIAMQEMAFSEGLMKAGSLSGRVIESNQDYSREFPLVTGFNRESFNLAFNDIFNYETKEFEGLREPARKVFMDYNYTTQLFESLKTSMSIERMKEHLKLGRKIVVFHRRQQANSRPPFAMIVDTTLANAKAVQNDPNSTGEQKVKATEATAQAEAFKEKYAELLQYEQTLNYGSAVDQIKAEFGDAATFLNGNVPTKAKKAAVKDFNTDDSPVKILVVQEEAGKEGISLHDTTGQHQRVLTSLSMPISTVTALQIEGRIYRIGQETDAIFEYPLLGLDLEVAYFGQNINKRLSTTENLAVGNASRDLIRSFAEGVLFNSNTDKPSAEQGKGGKEYDKREASATSDFQKAKLIYATNQKQVGRRDQRAGVDYFATPEPLGQKMVEWAGLKPGERMMEPSAGHGAIAMWAPTHSELTAVEPSFELYSKLGGRAGGGTKRVLNQRFEDLAVMNKYEAIVMNPPFGVGGKLAMEHLEKAFKHLANGGRIVAIVPMGAMDKRVDEFLYGTDANGKGLHPDAHLRANIKLPSITFTQAGTQVSSRVIIIDKVAVVDDFMDSKKNTVFADTISDFFDSIEFLDVPARVKVAKAEQTPLSNLTQSRDAKLPAATDKILAGPTPYTNTKTGKLLSEVKMTRYAADEYAGLNAKAKANNGYYSRFTKSFLFDKPEDAQKFVDSEDGPKFMAMPDGRKVQAVTVMPEVVDGFYSPLEKSLLEAKQDRLPVKQWLDRLNGDEAKWTGVREWLAGEVGTVAKADILDYLKNNRVQIKEVVKEGTETVPLHIVQDNRGRYFVARQDNNEPVTFPTTEREDAEAMLEDRNTTDASKTQYESYQLPGEKENYKEVLVTMPDKFIGFMATMENKYGSQWTKLMTAEEKATLESIKTKRGVVFESSHFNELNILVHLRMNTRTDADGKKVLFIEELQSDWAQKGRKEGFDTPDKWEVTENKLAPGYFSVYQNGKEVAVQLRQDAAEREMNRLKAQRNPKTVAAAPFVTNTADWVKLGLKVALKQAVAQGADKLAWATGEQENERYSLEKQVDYIGYWKSNSGEAEYQLLIKPKNEPEGARLVKENELEGLVGKETAQKIINGEGEHTGNVTSYGKNTTQRVLQGDNLKVGGKGMKAFYGSPSENNTGIIGQVAAKLFGQDIKTTDLHKGEKIKVVKKTNSNYEVISSADGFLSSFSNEVEAKEYAEKMMERFGIVAQTQHSITITPELIARVEAGQPMFMAAYNPTTPEQKALKAQLDAASADYQSAKTAYEKKRKELTKGFNNAMVDLFGQTKEQRGPQQKMFDEKPVLSAAEKALQPLRIRMEKAAELNNTLYNKYMGIEGSDSKQMAMFMAGNKNQLDLFSQKPTPNETTINGKTVQYESQQANDYSAGTDKVQAKQEKTSPYEVKSFEHVWRTTKFLDFTGSPKVKNAADVAHIMRLLEDASVEQAYAVHVDNNGDSHIQFLSVGGVAGTYVDPRVVLTGAVHFNSVKTYLVHNHPSGNMKPSEADMVLTSKISKLLKPVGVEIAHVVMDTYKKEYLLLDGYRNVETYSRGEKTENVDLPLHVIDRYKALTKPDFTKVTSSRNIAQFLYGLRFSVLPKKGMLMLNSANEIVANFILKSGSIEEALKKSAITPTASGLVLYGNQPYGKAQWAKDIVGHMPLAGDGFRVLDYVNVISENGYGKAYEYESAMDNGVLNDIQAEYGTNQLSEPNFMAAPASPSMTQYFNGVVNLLKTGTPVAQILPMLSMQVGPQMAQNIIANAQRRVAAMPNNSVLNFTPDQIRAAERTTADKIAHAWRKNFTSSEGVPNYFKELSEYAKGESQWIIRKADHFMNGTLKPAFKKMNADQKEGFMDLIGDLDAVTPAVQALLPGQMAIAQEFRKFVDDLSSEFIEQGWVSPNMAMTLLENMGNYLNRSYRIFNEADYEVPEAAKAQGAAFFVTQNVAQGMSIAEAEVQAEHQLKAYIAAAKSEYKGMKTLVESGRDNGIFITRENVPEPLRRVLGEYADPGEIFMMTVARMAATRSQAKYLQGVFDMGIGKIFWREDDANRDPLADTKIAGDSNQGWNPLNGLMTTKEIADYMHQAVTPENSVFVKAIQKGIGIVKMGKTVWSPVTQAKNIFGNLGWHMLNGYQFSNPVTKAIDTGRAFKFWYQNLLRKDGALDLWNQKMVKLGIFDSHIGTAEIKRMFASGDVEQIMNDARLATMAGTIGKVKRFFNDNLITRNYQLADVCSKFIAFQAEISSLAWALYRSDYDQLTPEQVIDVDRQAAERVKNTQPTSQRAYKGALWVSDHSKKLLGNFLTYRAESVRCFLNVFRYALKDIRSDNPRMQVLGARRMAGIVSYMAARTAVNYYFIQGAGLAMSGLMSAFDDDDEEKKNKLKGLNSLGPSWMRSAEKYAVKQADGTWEVTLINALEPFDMPFKIMNAYTNGSQNVKDPGVFAAIDEVFDPFIEASILAEAVRHNLIQGEDAYGNEHSTKVDKWMGVGKDLLPGWVSFVQRTQKREDGTTASWEEILNNQESLHTALNPLEFIGLRSYKLNPKLSFRSQIHDELANDNLLKSKLSDAEYDLGKGRIDKAKFESIKTDIAAGQKEIGQRLNQLRNDVVALQLTKTEADAMIKKLREIVVLSKPTKKEALKD